MTTMSFPARRPNTGASGDDEFARWRVSPADFQLSDHSGFAGELFPAVVNEISAPLATDLRRANSRIEQNHCVRRIYLPRRTPTAKLGWHVRSESLDRGGGDRRPAGRSRFASARLFRAADTGCGPTGDRAG